MAKSKNKMQDILYFNLSIDDWVIQRVAKQLEEQEVQRATQRALYAFARRYKGALQEFTPVDSGAARRGWRQRTIRGGIEFENLAQSKSSGEYYTRFLEYGSRPKQRPWPTVGDRTTTGYSRWGVQFEGWERSRQIMSKEAKYGIALPALESLGGKRKLADEIYDEILRGMLSETRKGSARVMRRG